MDEEDVKRYNNPIDFMDDWVFGPLNFIDRAEGLVTGLRFGDLGYVFSVRRCDHGGKLSLWECSRILKKYGVPIYGRTHNAMSMFFRVKRRQARWAEYLLIKAGATLTSPPFDVRNAKYAASRPGHMPTAWSEGGKKARKQKVGGRQVKYSAVDDMDRMINEVLKI